MSDDRPPVPRELIELDRIRDDALSVARALLAYRTAVKMTGIRRGAPAIGDPDAARRLIESLSEHGDDDG